MLRGLGIPPGPARERLGGVGGLIPVALVRTQIRLEREAGCYVHVRSEYAATTDPNVLDMCVLGRDITDLFAVIVDRPGDTVCLIGQRHSYRIEHR